MSLDFRVAALPYSTAITDSLNSQVANAPLRIQFAGVTPVPLPPLTGALWMLSNVPHGSVGKRSYNFPLRGK
mgnify:CR=1 FL=1|jgi:hypothetical protein